MRSLMRDSTEDIQLNGLITRGVFVQPANLGQNLLDVVDSEITVFDLGEVTAADKLP